jgi:hypothetical protein
MGHMEWWYMPELPAPVIISLGFCLALAGCAEGTSFNPAAFGLITGSTAVKHSPTTVYELVARGAKACWFAAEAPLHATHIFRAKAEPPARGAAAEIKIYERMPAAKLGLLAFSIGITGTRSIVPGTVEVENLRLAKPLAARMQRDVKRWTSGRAGCNDGRGDWRAALRKQPVDTRK